MTDTNFLTQLMEWLEEWNDSTETEGVKLFLGGVLKEHQRPVRTPALIVELPEIAKPNHLNMGQTHTDLKYNLHIQVCVQGPDPYETCIMADDLCKMLRWKIKEADQNREFEGINNLTHGDCQFYSLERADGGANLLVIVARQQIFYNVEEDYEEIGPLVASAHSRLKGWIDSKLLIESIEGTPYVEPEEPEPEEGEEE